MPPASPSPQPSAACGDYVITYDGPAPSIAEQALTPEIFIAEIVDVADAVLVPIGEHVSGEGEGSIVDQAFRLLTLDVTDVAKGSDRSSKRSIIVPGGTVGCARFVVAGLTDLAAGRRYAFFVEQSSLTLPGGPSAPVAYTAWPVSTAGEVKTPLDGDLTIDAFLSAVRSAGG